MKRIFTAFILLTAFILTPFGPHCGPAGMGSGVLCASVPDSTLTGDKGIVLKGGIDGSTLEDLTVEGEDRISVDFERPALTLDIPLRKAPGLGWEGSWERTDIFAALIRDTAFRKSATIARPWLDLFSDSDVAVFRPEAGKADKWRMTLADSRGRAVRIFEGKGKIPGEVVWDGRKTDGDPALAGLTYSFVLETWDRAGNPRTFVGEGFDLPPFIVREESETMLVFAGHAVDHSKSTAYGQIAGEPILMEAASWLNQSGGPSSPVVVEATARTNIQAEQIARHVVEGIEGMLAGDPGRISYRTKVLDDAPDCGSIEIVIARKQ